MIISKISTVPTSLKIQAQAQQTNSMCDRRRGRVRVVFGAWYHRKLREELQFKEIYVLRILLNVAIVSDGLINLI